MKLSEWLINTEADEDVPEAWQLLRPYQFAIVAQVIDPDDGSDNIAGWSSTDLPVWVELGMLEWRCETVRQRIGISTELEEYEEG